MKNLLQVSSLLSVCAIKTEMDWKGIMGVCNSEYQTSVNNTPQLDPEAGMSFTDFCSWLDVGFGPGDICRLGDDLVICGNCTLRCSTIVARLSDDKLHICEEIVQQEALKTANPEEVALFFRMMSQNKLQFNANEMKLVERFIPKPLDRVAFSCPSFSGIGVIKAIHPEENLVDYYCYYINETKQVGYSMNETGITKLHEVIFEPMNQSSQRISLGNVMYLQRKFNKALAKFGKIWNERLHRIEPLDYSVPMGEPYWYFGKNLELLSSTEKGSAVAKERRYLGNYFRSLEEGLYYQRKFLLELTERFGDSDPEYVRIVGEHERKSKLSGKG